MYMLKNFIGPLKIKGKVKMFLKSTVTCPKQGNFD